MNKYNEELRKELGFVPVAFVGGVRSGKSTASKILEKEFGYAPTLSFGSKLKTLAHEAFEHLPISKEAKPVTLYQQFGQKLRSIDDSVWISHVEQEYLRIKQYTRVTGVVIDDLRQPNEYQWAKENGFVIVRIDVPEEERVRRAEALGEVLTEDNLNYETESYYSKFEVDGVIINEGSPEEFEQQVINVMKKIYHKMIEAKRNEERSSIVPLIKSLPYSHSASESGSEIGYIIYTTVSEAMERILGKDSVEYKVLHELYIEDNTRGVASRNLGISEWKVRHVRNYALDLLYPVLKELLDREGY